MGRGMCFLLFSLQDWTGQGVPLIVNSMSFRPSVIVPKPSGAISNKCRKEMIGGRSVFIT